MTKDKLETKAKQSANAQKQPRKSGKFASKPVKAAKAPTVAGVKGSKKGTSKKETTGALAFVVPEYFNADLVSSPLVTERELFELTKYGSAEVRVRVARKENLSKEIVDLLSQDKNFDVLSALIGNASTPKGVCTIVANRVKEAESFYYTPPVYTTSSLAGSRDFVQPLAEYVLSDEKRAMFKYTLLDAHQIDLDPGLLDDWSTDKELQVREAVIRHPSTGITTLQNMLNDPSRKIRKKAKEALNKNINETWGGELHNSHPANYS